MSDLFHKLRNVSQNIVVKVSVLAPLLLTNHSSLDENPSVLTWPGTILGVLHLFVFLFMFQVGMKLVNPFLIHFQ